MHKICPEYRYTRVNLIKGFNEAENVSKDCQKNVSKSVFTNVNILFEDPSGFWQLPL